MEHTIAAGEKIYLIDPALILPNPSQPRRVFDSDALEGLADSVKQFGILQPLTVREIRRRGEVKYELIAGERRMRAGILAGLNRVPCRILSAGEETSAAIAIVENLQRKNLNPFEEASAIATLLDTHELTQEKLAERLSVSQSYIANKLRLLKFTSEEQTTALAAGLTERHCRALLRLTEPDVRKSALLHIISQGYNVAQAEAYIDRLVAVEEKNRKKRKIKGAIGDLRLFYNSLDRALDIMRGAGMAAKCKRRETEDGVEVTILIKKR